MSEHEWAVAKLGDPNVATLVMGQSPPSSAYNSSGNGLPFFQGKADFGMPYPVARVWCTEPQRIAEKNDVLISVRAPVGDVNIATSKCCLGRGLAAIRPAKKTHFAFLFFALAQSKERLASLSSGTTFESINKNTLEDFEIPLPPRPEQQKIATVLWKVQKAIEIQDKLVRTTRELKAAAMRKVFTRGVRNEALKETEIGPMPNSWEPRRLETCCHVVMSSLSYTDFSALNESTDQDALRAMGIKVSDMNLPGNERVITHANLEKRVPPALAKRKLVPPQAVVFPKRGAAIATNKKRMTSAWTVLDPNLIGVRPLQGLDARFLFYWFQQFDLRSITEPGPTPQLNKKNLVPLVLPLPRNEDEQSEIADALDVLDRKIEHHERKRAALDDLFKSLLNKLMTGQIRVDKLDIDISEVAAC